MKKAALKLAKGARSKGVFAPIDPALKAIRAGEMIIVVDEDRERGDLDGGVKVTPEAVSFRWLTGAGFDRDDAGRLDELEFRWRYPTTRRAGTAFAYPSMPGRTSTGISTADRAPSRSPSVLTKPRTCHGPGMFRCGRVSGMLVRSGHLRRRGPRASPRLAPEDCEVMNDDGSMARVPSSRSSRKHRLLMSRSPLISYRAPRSRDRWRRRRCRRCRAFTVHYDSVIDGQTLAHAWRSRRRESVRRVTRSA